MSIYSTIDYIFPHFVKNQITNFVLCHLYHKLKKYVHQISEPVNGIPKILKLKIPDIEFFKLLKVLKLSPSQ